MKGAHPFTLPLRKDRSPVRAVKLDSAIIYDMYMRAIYTVLYTVVVQLNKTISTSKEPFHYRNKLYILLLHYLSIVHEMFGVI